MKTPLRCLLASAVLALPMAAQMPPNVAAQQQMFSMQQQMFRQQQMMMAAQAALAAKRAQQAALAARKSAPTAQPLLLKPTKEVWAGPSVIGELQTCLEGEGLLVVGKKPRKLMVLDRMTGKARWEDPLEEKLLLEPVVMGDHVFYVTKDGQGQLLDAATGKQRRSVPLETYDEFLMSGRKSHTRVLPPILAEGRLVVAVFGKGKLTGKAAGKVQAFDPATGAKVWEVEIPGGPDLMPAFHGAHVLVGGDGQVMALDAATGKTTWTTSVGKGGGSSELDFGFLLGDRLILVCEKNRIGLDATTGKELWRSEVKDGGTSTLAGEGSRIIHLEYRGLFVVDTWLVALDPNTGKVAWELESDKSKFPWAQDGAVFCNRKKELQQLNLADAKTMWKLALGSIPDSPFLPGDGMIYVAFDELQPGEDGRVDFRSVIKAVSLKDGQPRWNHILATPYAQGFILADEKGLVYLAKDGKPVRIE